jgi:hypothetical protein
MGLLALAAALVKSLLSSFASSFGGALGTGLAGLAINGLKGTSSPEVVAQLRTNPTASTCVAAQNSLAEQMKRDPIFRQRAEEELQKESPREWDWARTTGQTVSDWNVYFTNTLVDTKKWFADYVRKQYAISNHQYQYLLTGKCPINGEVTGVTYYKPTGGAPPFDHSEVSLGSWFWGTDSDPYDDKLVKGSFGMCRQGHRWRVWAADEAAGGS